MNDILLHEIECNSKRKQIYKLMQKLNGNYKDETIAATSLWLDYISEYSLNNTYITRVCNIIDNDPHIIADVFKDTKIVQFALFGESNSITKIPFSNLQNIVVSSYRLGFGSFGTVFAGSLDDKNVAIKSYTYIEERKVTNNYQEWCVCMKEIAILSRLQNTNIVGKIHGAGWNKGCWTVVMERHWLRSLKWKHHYLNTLDNTKQIVSDIFNAIHTIHITTGYIHGDVKPDNIMIDIVDECPIVKIIDFGLAEPIGILEKDHQYVQTIYWRSPELLKEESCDLILTDAWATAITVLDIMAGRCLMYELGAKANISEYEMLNIILQKCMTQTVIPSEWQEFIHEELIEFANSIYANYIVGANERKGFTENKNNRCIIN